MKRVIFTETGLPETVVRVEEDVPAPQPRRGEVLLRMLAAPVNPSDLMYILGRYGLQPKLPAVPGFEGVGIVEAHGGGLLGRLRLHRRVAVLGARTGTWSEYTVASARQVVPVPDDLPDDQAATFFVNPATALAMVRSVLQVPPGEWLMQTAAASEVGKMVIRLGRRYGFRTLNVVRRAEQVEELHKLGADAVVVAGTEPLAAAVARIAPGGVRYALDPVGGTLGSELIAALAAGGRALVYGSLADQFLNIHPRFLITTGVRIEGFWLATWMRQQGIFRLWGLVRQMRQLIREGVLQSTIAAQYPLEQVRAAVEHAQRPGKGGKVLLRIGH